MAQTRAAATRASARKRAASHTHHSDTEAVLSGDNKLTDPDYENHKSSKNNKEADNPSPGNGKAEKVSDHEKEITTPKITNEPDNNGEETDKADNDNPVIGMQRSDKKKLCVKAMGRVRADENGELEWFDPVSKEWKPAVYHKDIREELIKYAAKLGKYRYPMAHGKHELDVTAFHPAFKYNGRKREQWPKILFKYLPSQSDLSHVKPEYWQLHDGRIVLDMNNDAMYDYPEIPMTLARNADAWLLLAVMRMNSTISVQDLRGRMMGDMNPKRADPMGRNRISMNMQRFRKFACCLSWNSIRAVDVQRDYLEKKLPRRCIRKNSTESFRMLYAHEAAELDLRDAGRFLHRTRAKERDLSQAKSEAIYDKKHKEFEELKKRFEKKYPNGAPNDYDSEDEEYRAQKANMPQPEKELPMEHSEPVEESEDGSNAEDATPVKRRGRKKQKVEHPTPATKKLFIFPDDQPSPASSPPPEHEVCRRGHREYAGFFTVAPNTVYDAQLLYDLLAPTREHFKTCTDFEPPKTEGDECYKCQHRDIQNALNEWHAEQPSLVNKPVVKLVGILWIDDDTLWWNTKWDNKWFGPRLECEFLLGRTQTDGILEW
ncbi:MAG: hypothetical protein Q9225_003489 [Loekoesia sp. 1 TL-2023]